MTSEAIAIDPWIAFGIGAVVLAVLALAIFASRERKPAASTDAKLDALATRLEVAEAKWKETDHDVRSIRMVVNNLPTKESINAIAVQVAESRGKMEGIQSTIQGLAKSCDRIEDFLLKTSAETIASVKAAVKSNGD